jgi:hypothetical protein
MKSFVEDLLKLYLLIWTKFSQAKLFNLKLKKQLTKFDARIEQLKRSEDKILFLRTAAKAHNGIIMKELFCLLLFNYKN